VPRLEVAAAVDELMTRLRVVRLAADPPYWPTEIDEWAAKYGEKRRGALGDLPARCRCTPPANGC
jgi:hypothetical protein